MKTVQTSANYCISLSLPQFRRIQWTGLRYEDEIFEAIVDRLNDNTGKLQVWNVTEIEYNGHFGANFFYALSLPDTLGLSPEILATASAEVERRLREFVDCRYLFRKARFTYPYYGTPDSHPDYTAHSGQTVTILRRLLPPEASAEVEMYVVKAEDGWEGSVHRDELKIRRKE